MPQTTQEFWPFAKEKTTGHIKSSDEASVLQKQLGDMEGEVKEIQMELAAIKLDRLDLASGKAMKTYAIPEVETAVTHSAQLESQLVPHEESFKRVPGISKLREELIRAKHVAEEEKFQREKYETKLKDLEQQLNNICSTGVIAESNESRQITDEKVAALKTQIKMMTEEMEELNITITEKTEQLQDYRVKYLQAQQQVEELKRQMDVIEIDNKQVSDQIQIEIQKMKMQFQEKLQELAPLPDLLKGAQMQLQEATQLQRLAEDSSHQISNELQRVKEKLVVAVKSMNQEKSEKTNLIKENKLLQTSLDEKVQEVGELSKCLDDYKCMVMRLEEKLKHQDTFSKEKSSECAKLLKDLEETKNENTRTLFRCKERSESMRRYLYTQISELERQLIQSRAQLRACQKERDDVRQRMQIQINNLQENYELVEIRLRTLQGQVSSLKSSYTVILAGENDTTDKIITT